MGIFESYVRHSFFNQSIGCRQMLYLSEIDKSIIKGKTVLLRVDFNVPVTDGKISDYSRIELVIPTIKYLLSINASVVLISHFGRPDGKSVPALSLKFLVPELTRLLSTEVKFMDWRGNVTPSLVTSLRKSKILLLENIRFHEGELSNNSKFAKNIAALGEIYINDAFSCSHRAHASISAITEFLPSYAGFLLEQEVKNLNTFSNNSMTPNVAIIGGKKISTKLAILQNLSHKMDCLVISGAMANTFLKAQGYEIGTSFYEPELVESASKILADSKSEIVLPIDFISPNGTQSNKIKFLDLHNVGKKDNLLDIGPLSCVKICSVLAKAKNVVWNGPLGMFEDKRFALGTNFVAHYLAAATSKGSLTSIVGGGDTLSAIADSCVKDQFTYVSSAGGAFLEWLEGSELPGIIALKNKHPA